MMIYHTNSCENYSMKLLDEDTQQKRMLPETQQRVLAKILPRKESFSKLPSSRVLAGDSKLEGSAFC